MISYVKRLKSEKLASINLQSIKKRKQPKYLRGAILSRNNEPLRARRVLCNEEICQR